MTTEQQADPMARLRASKAEYDEEQKAKALREAEESEKKRQEH
jgi:hypothetical protein